MPLLSANKREYLIHPWLLALLLVAVLAILGLLVPRHSFLSHPETIKNPDSLSVFYLRALLDHMPKNDPNNNELRELYVEHLADTGRVAEAEKQLQAVNAKTTAEQSKLVVLALHLKVLRLLKQPDNEKMRKRTEMALKNVFNLPPDVMTVQQWQELADLLVKAGLTSWGARSYLRLAILDKNNQDRWLGSASKWLVASGQSDQAGVVQLLRVEISGDIKDARKAIDYFLAADRADQAILALPSLIEQFPQDRDLLQKAIKIARSKSEFTYAIEWSKNWLQSYPKDTGVIQELIQIYIASSNPAAAFPWARIIVQIMPDNEDGHLQLAQISVWTIHLHVALIQWQWLAKYGHNKQVSLKRAIALALQLLEYPTADKLLVRSVADYELTRKKATKLVWLKEELGKPKDSEKVRIAYLKTAPQDREAWEQLAMLQEYLGKLDEATSTWLEIDKRFGSSESEIIHRAHMLNVRDLSEEGLKIMRDFAQNHHPVLDSYWRAYGNLAWSLEYHADAVRAYQWLWDHTKSNLSDTQRLITLLQEEGGVEAVLTISQHAWQRFNNPGMLLLAIESAMQGEHWLDVKRLMANADSYKSSFHHRLQYWLLHARWMVYEHHLNRAERDYRLALDLASGDVSARTGLLWIWIQTNRQKLLERYLVQWRGDAEQEEAYWQAYAAAYRQLGKYRSSLPWFRKIIIAYPDSVLWMLEYADALDSSGRASSALRLRRFLFREMWPKSRMSIDYVRKNGIAMANAIARMQQRFLGLPYAEKWVDTLIHHSNDPVVREFAMLWYFDIGRHSQAVFWLMRQHAARLHTPAWQQLALAMEENNLEQIQHIISRADDMIHGGVRLRLAKHIILHEPEIDRVSNMLAKRQLNRLDDAWVLAMDNELGAGGSVDEQLTMLRYARDISALSPNAFHLGWSLDRFGTLTLRNWTTKSFYSRNNHTFSLLAKFTHLNTDTGFARLVGSNREYEFRLATAFQFRDAYGLYVGTNVRNRGVVDTGRLLQWGGGVNWRLWQGGQLALALSMHDVSMETSAFRILGARDQIKLSFSSDVTSREYFATNVSLNRYQTRQSDALASGYTVGATLGHRLILGNSLAEQQMQIRLTGELVRNRLQPQLSPFVRELLPGSTVSAIIPKDFSSIGIGLNVQRGQLGNNEAVARMPVYLFDIWLGSQWPNISLGYSVDFGVGLPVFGLDMLSLQAYVRNNLVGSIGSELLSGINLSYGYRFAR